ncbi:hypothetical protein C5O80_14625 [Burkholderia sp. SRS-46]|nr:hypothetical protein C5O80_14625 [Burkholderia sp. SRS-46]
MRSIRVDVNPGADKMKTHHSIRPANAEDSMRIAVLGAHVWVHTYATAGVSDVIADYVMTTFTPDRFRALLNDPDIVLSIAEPDMNLAGYIVMRFDVRSITPAE